jgi:hypothetical protein
MLLATSEIEGTTGKVEMVQQMAVFCFCSF